MSQIAEIAKKSEEIGVQKEKPNFYEQLDIVFDQLYEKYGLTDELMQFKSDLLYVYDNERGWRSAELLKLIKPKRWYIDERGRVVSVPDATTPKK